MSRTYERKLKKVENKIVKPKGDHLRILRKMTRRKVRKFVFKHVTVEEIEKKIEKVDDKPSSSTCGISYEVIKKMKNFVKNTIQQMTNLSMDLGHYPNPSKHGLIKPLYKGEPKKKKDPEDFRPVNILPGPGRIMDMCTSEQQTKFAEQLGIIPRAVHGFREGHGTITAAIEMQTHVHKYLST